MDTNSETTSSSSNNPEKDFDIKLKIGGVASTFSGDGFWRHKFPSNKKNCEIFKNSNP